MNVVDAYKIIDRVYKAFHDFNLAKGEIYRALEKIPDEEMQYLIDNILDILSTKRRDIGNMFLVLDSLKNNMENLYRWEIGVDKY